MGLSYSQDMEHNSYSVNIVVHIKNYTNDLSPFLKCAFNVEEDSVNKAKWNVEALSSQYRSVHGNMKVGSINANLTSKVNSPSTVK